MPAASKVDYRNEDRRALKRGPIPGPWRGRQLVDTETGQRGAEPRPRKMKQTC